MEAAVPFDPYDLPGYAARLVRLHERRPEIMRLCTWQRLERTDGEPNPGGARCTSAPRGWLVRKLQLAIIQQPTIYSSNILLVFNC
jgi:hypothetical protein